MFDNNSKAPSGPVETAMLASARPKRCYAYVGSAGIYEKPASHPFNSPLNEDMPVTASKACAEFETALAATGVPHVLFRCQVSVVVLSCCGEPLIKPTTLSPVYLRPPLQQALP